MVTAGRRRASRCVGSSPTCCTKLVFDLCDIEVKKLSNLRYKVGDVVIVRSDLDTTNYYDGVSVTYGMMKTMRGRKATIKSIENHTYRIQEYSCYWNDEMFEDVIPVAEIDDKSRADSGELSSGVSIKDLFSLYNM